MDEKLKVACAVRNLQEQHCVHDGMEVAGCSNGFRK